MKHIKIKKNQNQWKTTKIDDEQQKNSKYSKYPLKVFKQ